MKLLDYVRARMWIPVLGYGFYVAALTAGYYNLTFVQLGLVDQAPDWSGRRDVSMAMVVLAVIAFRRHGGHRRRHGPAAVEHQSALQDPPAAGHRHDATRADVDRAGNPHTRLAVLPSPQQ